MTSGIAMFASRCPWYIAGPLLGLLIVILRAAVNTPLGALGGYSDIVTCAARPRHVGFGAFMLLGIVFGGALFSTAAGTWLPTFGYADVVLPLTANPGSQVALLVVAGAAMGFGARAAGGCTSGHGLSGTSAGSPASVAATLTFFAVAVALAHLLLWIRPTA